MNYCPSCGYQLNDEYKFCPGCGLIIGQDKDETNLSNEVDSKTKRHDKKKFTSADKKKNAKTINQTFKIFSTAKLFYLSFALFLIGLIIVFTSGIFDKPQQVNANGFGSENNPHSGVDLKSLEQINSLEEKVKANPKDTYSLLNLAHLLNDSGFKEKAIDRYKEYLKTDSKNADVLVDMGVCYFEIGKSSEAINAMEGALKIQPKHQIAHLNLGIVNSSIGNSEKAIQWWKKAVEINPTNDIGKKAQELINSH